MHKAEYEIIAKHLAPVYREYQDMDKHGERLSNAVLDMLCVLTHAFEELNPTFDTPTFARAVAGEDSNIAWVITGDEDLNTDEIGNNKDG